MGNHRLMPSDVAISSAESSPSNSNDEGPCKLHERQIKPPIESKQLHTAVSQLSQRRRPSLSQVSAAGADVNPYNPSGFNAMHLGLRTGSVNALGRMGGAVWASNGSEGNGSRGSSDNANNRGRGSGSGDRGRSSNVRSTTEPNISTIPASGSSMVVVDNALGATAERKSSTVQKKSGELLWSALRHGTHRHPSSMPGTPTFSKKVHFDANLEYVRHFFQAEKPMAVSAGSSLVNDYDSESESEYPFTMPQSSQARTDSRQERNAPAKEWEMIASKFPLDTPEQKAMTIRLERVWFSADQKSLRGSVAVLNLAFVKAVVCRFTLDCWKTISEVVAEYSAEILPRAVPQGHDRFSFVINLSDIADIETKTMYFCIRYEVNGKVFWDNNGGNNFLVDFNILPAADWPGICQMRTPPRNTRRIDPSTEFTPPFRVSTHVSLDGCCNGGKLTPSQPLQEYVIEPIPTLRLKSTQPSSILSGDNLASLISSPSGQTFANRYDFGISLGAAMQAVKDVASVNHDGIYMESGRKPVVHESFSAPSFSPGPVVPVTTVPRRLPIIPASSAKISGSAAITLPTTAWVRNSHVIRTGSGAFHHTESIESQSHDEIVRKYCFHIPKQPDQVEDEALPFRQLNPSLGEAVTQCKSSPSSFTSGIPLEMGGIDRHPLSGKHHSIPKKKADVSSTIGNTLLAAASPSLTSNHKECQQSPRSMARTLPPPHMPSASNTSQLAFPVPPGSMVDNISPLYDSRTASSFAQNRRKDFGVGGLFAIVWGVFCHLIVARLHRWKKQW